MTITYQLNSPEDIDKNFIDSVKAAFKDMPLRIFIEVDNGLNDNESKKHPKIIDEQTIFIEHLIQNDTSFKFLKDEDDIYTLDDLKVKY